VGSRPWLSVAKLFRKEAVLNRNEKKMAKDPITGSAAETSERRAFYDKIDKKNLAALWLSLADLVTPEPRSACRPACWRFDDIREYMLEAGALISAK
jgi:gentisate 1,2-dioxygenase